MGPKAAFSIQSWKVMRWGRGNISFLWFSKLRVEEENRKQIVTNINYSLKTENEKKEGFRVPYCKSPLCGVKVILGIEQILPEEVIESSGEDGELIWGFRLRKFIRSALKL